MASNDSSARAGNKKRKWKDSESASTEKSIKGEDGKSESCPWTEAQDQVLFDRVEEFLTTVGTEPTTKPKVKIVYPKNIVWENIKFDDFSAENCKTRWLMLSSRVRKMRSAKEILDDARRQYTDRKQTARKKSKTDLNAGQPKRPMTAFFLYVQAKRTTFSENHPDLNGKEVIQRLTSKWKKLPEKKRRKYQRRYAKEKIEFDEKERAYLIEHHPELEPPKSAFELWSVEERKRITELRGEISQKKIVKKLERHWENLDDDVKTDWEGRAKREYKKFKSKVSKEERKKEKTAL